MVRTCTKSKASGIKVVGDNLMKGENNLVVEPRWNSDSCGACAHTRCALSGLLSVILDLIRFFFFKKSR
jgi:hypothetical protein